MAEKKRAANIELLRSIAMIMVVILHFLRESGSLPLAEAGENGEPMSTVNLAATFLEAFCIVAVNVYVLISGYFGAESRFRPSKAIGFLCQIWFYALLIPLVLKCFGIPVLSDTIGIYGWIQYLLPVLTEHYWFATSYFYLLLLMPVLNGAVRQLSKRQLSVVVSGLLLVVCGVKSICPVLLVTDHFGYDVVWFICLYLLGAWLFCCGEGALSFMKKKALSLYVGSCLITGLMTVVLYGALGKISGFAYYFSVPFHYNFVFCLTGAVGLFFVFGNLSVKEGKMADLIRKIGKYCFGVYLLHEHIDIRNRWYGVLTGMINPGKESTGILFVAELLFCVAVIFAAGILVDVVRSLFFGAAAKFLQRTPLGKIPGLLEKE